jgi:dihydroorotase
MTNEGKRVLLKNVMIIDPRSTYHKAKCDILIDDGKIIKIDSQSIEIKEDTQVHELENCLVSPGWCDVGAHCGEPGEEINETLESLSEAAAAGGYTAVGIFSNDAYPFDNKNLVSDIYNRSRDLAAQCIPIPALSKKKEGKELAEFFELATVAPALFSDGLTFIKDSSLVYKALEYSKPIKGTICMTAGTYDLHGGGQVNESNVSASMGLVGLPARGEYMATQQALELLAYSKGRMYFHAVTDRKSLELIQQKRKEGLQLACSVPALNLFYIDEDTTDFDENLKVIPPLRSQEDKNAIIQALLKKEINLVVSNHQPISQETKDVEFLHTPFGAIGIQSVYGILNTALGDYDPELIYTILSQSPRELLGLEVPLLEVGQQADLTIFNPNEESVLTKADIKSLSYNSAMTGKKLKGMVVGTIRSGIISIN